jgi:hypothetical protein
MSKVFKSIFSSPSPAAPPAAAPPAKPVVSPKPAVSALVTEKKEPTKTKRRPRKLASYESVLTSGTGVAGPAQVEKKQLLGS